MKSFTQRYVYEMKKESVFYDTLWDYKEVICENTEKFL